MISLRKMALSLAISTALGITGNAQADRDEKAPMQFERIATFPVFLNTDVELETVAEIIDATPDGQTLVYTDSATENLGFIDISDPANPQAVGVVAVGGEPTSVAVRGKFALVAVNTSEDYVNTSGHLHVVDIEDRDIVVTLDMEGQPDSVAVSPDGRYAAVAIENERDEDLFVKGVEGGLPQLPSGFLQIIDLKGHPLNWTTRMVALTGLADIAPSDAETEYVDINKRNIAAVTLQENNHIVYVNLRTGQVINDYSAGDVDLDSIDTVEDDVIRLTDSLEAVKREPDAITWIGNNHTATANEGDYEGGSRGFSIFHRQSGLKWDASNSYEHIAVRHGHYPESRSENKGAEPEGIEYARYGKSQFLFVGSERGNFVAVYRIRGVKKPEFVQLLPVTNGPEGLKAIPKRNLFVVSSEVDDAGEGLRSTVSIFQLQRGKASYPTILSEEAPDNEEVPIAWGALSALVGDNEDGEILYSVHDSYYKEPRIYTIEVDEKPAEIEDVTILKGGPSNCPADCDYDPEGIAQARNGSFWIASEGNADRDNLLIHVTKKGKVLEEVTLPPEVQALKKNNGFEGVAMARNGDLIVAFQREWVDDPAGLVRIGRYSPKTGEWAFYYYPLDEVESPAGGWIGLSEVTALGHDRFAVIERDNQRGLDARVKRLYTFSLEDLIPVEQGGDFPIIEKTLARDILPDLQAPQGWVQDKPEGLAVSAEGEVYLVTDNDGVDDSTGETQFQHLGNAKSVFGK
jgi:hypothetical protein